MNVLYRISTFKIIFLINIKLIPGFRKDNGFFFATESVRHRELPFSCIQGSLSSGKKPFLFPVASHNSIPSADVVSIDETMRVTSAKANSH